MTANVEQGSFFDHQQDVRAAAAQPLAVRMRPQQLSEVVGQEPIVGPDGLLPRLIESDHFGSLIFMGLRAAVRPRSPR